jgi:hypothetical protein
MSAASGEIVPRESGERVAYLVAKRNSLADYPPLCRLYVLFVIPLVALFWPKRLVDFQRYARFQKAWKYADIDVQGILETEREGDEACRDKPLWFWSRAPYGRLLQDGPCEYGHSFPASPARKRYLKIVPYKEEGRLPETQTSDAHNDLNVCLENIPCVEARFADLEARVSQLERGRHGKDSDC